MVLLSKSRLSYCNWCRLRLRPSADLLSVQSFQTRSLPLSVLSIPLRRKKRKEKIGGTIRLRNQYCDDCLIHQDLELMGLKVRSLERELELETKRVRAMASNDYIGKRPMLLKGTSIIS